ncbi:MAG: ribosome silencing factor [Anaerolineales bacterium]|nr:ribosome silencing factor [Anaerolineales bacterium]
MTETGLEIAHTIVESLEEKKGEDILLLDLIGICSFTDYFVVCTAGSERTLKALAEGARLQVKEKHSQVTITVEGDAESGWILIDYGDVILHLFSTALREYYQLEELWREGQILLHIQ